MTLIVYINPNEILKIHTKRSLVDFHRYRSLYSRFISAKDNGDSSKFVETLDQLSRMLIYG